MQRQVRILNRAGKRAAFALMAAIFLMLLVSLMLLKMLSYSSENSQQVINEYLLEQATLVAYGATEYTMLQLSTDDRSVACTKNISMSYPASGTKIFDVNVTVQYVWATGMAPGGTDCGNTAVTGNTVTVNTPAQNGSAYIDVAVSSDDTNLQLDEPIRVFRRTLQKL